MKFKKFIIGAAIAVAGVVAWAASDNNAFKADEADATVYQVEAYGKVVGYCYTAPSTCYLSGGYVIYDFPGRQN